MGISFVVRDPYDSDKLYQIRVGEKGLRSLPADDRGMFLLRQSERFVPDNVLGSMLYAAQDGWDSEQARDACDWLSEMAFLAAKLANSMESQDRTSEPLSELEYEDQQIIGQMMTACNMEDWRYKTPVRE